MVCKTQRHKRIMCHLGTERQQRLLVYLQQNKKKAKAEGKKCHAKTM